VSRATLDRIADAGVVAVLRGGVGAVEVTLDATGAVETLAAVRTALDDETLVGAGTVMDAAAASRAVGAGAEFVVAPHVDTSVVETANRYGVAAMPGAMTPTEAVRAAEAGADAVKVFPAATVGPAHLRRLRGPLPQIPLVPTGGVDADSVDEFFAAGATAVGAGSALVDDAAVAAGDWGAVEARAREFVGAVADARD
jgi:2-dehydro-3-deoxyphosphogluconate aldolase/(4S)-4-hydroxy-2-oxoglutarate aldolase